MSLGFTLQKDFTQILKCLNLLFLRNSKPMLIIRAVARVGGRGKKLRKINHKNRENQGKWEEKGKIGKEMGSLPEACLRTGRAGYGPASTKP